MTLDAETIAWLASPEGAAVLAELAGQPLDDGNRLSTLTRLRKRLPRERAAASLDQALLRRRATEKFSRASEMFFTREALEQATSEEVARHRAQRLRGCRLVLDLGCGIGGDAIALAEVARVVAVDRDETRLRLAELNATVYGVGDRIRFVCADYTHEPLPPADAVFLDPSRRQQGDRIFSIFDYDPPLTIVSDLARRYPTVVAKIAPGVDYGELDRLGVDGEVEIVSLRGECKEATLWIGDRREVARRATILPDGVELTDRDAAAPVPVRSPGGYLFEPDAAVIRAHLVAQLATRFRLAQIDEQIAYLTADTVPPGIAPYADVYPVLDWFPFNLKALNERLRAGGVGRVTIKKRGSPIVPEELRRRLKLRGDAERVIVLTRVHDEPHVLICAPPIDAVSDRHDASSPHLPSVNRGSSPNRD